MASPFSKFVLGTLIGGTVGAVLGLLLAPRKGSETRQIIANEVTERYQATKSAAETNWKESVDKAKECYATSSEEIKAKAEQLKSKADSLKAELEDKVKVVSSQVKETVKVQADKVSDKVAETAHTLEDKGRTVLSQFAPKATPAD
jgi:gas vesicle protein